MNQVLAFSIDTFRSTDDGAVETRYFNHINDECDLIGLPSDPELPNPVTVKAYIDRVEHAGIVSAILAACLPCLLC